ncbi:MAG: alpha/beta fold hydrolase [Thermoguttaceae bacterium]
MQFGRCASSLVACFRRGLWRRIVSAVVVAVFAAAVSSTAFAQQKKTEAKDKKAGSSPKLENDLVRRTHDGLQLALTYYPGAVGDELEQGKGRKTIPIVLLHGLKQSRNDFKDLARALQKSGYAVIVPDMRGHGESTRRVGYSRDDTLDSAKLTPNQFGLMVTQDMRAVKDFLWEKNNAGELNIDKLCIVGAEMGSSVALNFALVDTIEQERNQVPRPNYKVGCFVKALVLISPELSFRGLPTRMAATYPHVQGDISVMIVVGKQDAKALSEARRLYGIFAKSHPEPVGDDKLDKQTLVWNDLDTKLQGTKLLDPKFNLPAAIAAFIQRRLVKSDAAKDWTWRKRSFPYE